MCAPLFPLPFSGSTQGSLSMLHDGSIRSVPPGAEAGSGGASVLKCGRGVATEKSVTISVFLQPDFLVGSPC